ncbi:hypothetical protein ACRCUN_21795 [Mycobacterium sp. LTG2003]
MSQAKNTLVLEAKVFPDYHRVYIEDFETSDGADSSDSACSCTGHSILVRTITADEAIDSDIDVSVNIYKGIDDRSLGECIYAGTLTLDSGYLAIGNAGDTIARAPFEVGETISLRVFVDKPSDARQINVLIPPE